MTDKNLTDAEIKKALECCKCGTLNDCDGCPCFSDEDIDTARECAENLMSNALDLINRLQAENDKLKKAKYVFANVDYCADDLDKALKENEELKSAINGFRGYEDKTKAEAYKEFAEKVKQNQRKLFNYIYTKDGFGEIIDNLLKELVGEDSETR